MNIQGSGRGWLLAAVTVPVTVLAVMIVLGFDDSGAQPEDAGAAPPPAAVQPIRLPAPGDLSNADDARRRCVTFEQQANRARLGECGLVPQWRRNDFPNGYSRLDAAVQDDRCLGVNHLPEAKKVVGSWDCVSTNSAWKFEWLGDGFYRLRNQFAVDNGWQAACLTFRGRTLYLGPCDSHPATRWRFAPDANARHTSGPNVSVPRPTSLESRT